MDEELIRQEFWLSDVGDSGGRVALLQQQKGAVSLGSIDSIAVEVGILIAKVTQKTLQS